MYSILFNKILNPFYEQIIKRRNSCKYRKFLDRSQWWTIEQLRVYQLSEFSKLLDHAYENVPYYRRVFKEKGLHPDHIQTRNDFNNIPFLTKQDIRGNQDSPFMGR